MNEPITTEDEMTDNDGNPTTPSFETPIPEKREFTINRPGFINWSDGKSNYPGSHLKEFHNTSEGSATDAVNKFFTERANLLTVSMWIDYSGVIYVLYTNMLEGEELEEFQEHSRALTLHMQEWREARVARKREAARRANEAEEEIKRKVRLAEHCEKNHGRAEKKAKKEKA